MAPRSAKYVAGDAVMARIDWCWYKGEVLDPAPTTHDTDQVYIYEVKFHSWATEGTQGDTWDDWILASGPPTWVQLAPARHFQRRFREDNLRFPK